MKFTNPLCRHCSPKGANEDQKFLVGDLHVQVVDGSDITVALSDILKRDGGHEFCFPVHDRKHVTSATEGRCFSKVHDFQIELIDQISIEFNRTEPRRANALTPRLFARVG